MKTHELAKALNSLASVLKHTDNVQLEQLRFNSLSPEKTTGENVPIALSTLVALSKFDKSQWLEIIKAYEFPIQIRARDASRDILGKILNHLEQSPEARLRLANQATRSSSKTSPELLSALQILLRK